MLSYSFHNRWGQTGIILQLELIKQLRVAFFLLVQGNWDSGGGEDRKRALLWSPNLRIAEMAVLQDLGHTSIQRSMKYLHSGQTITEALLFAQNLFLIFQTDQEVVPGKFTFRGQKWACCYIFKLQLFFFCSYLRSQLSSKYRWQDSDLWNQALTFTFQAPLALKGKKISSFNSFYSTWEEKENEHLCIYAGYHILEKTQSKCKQCEWKRLKRTHAVCCRWTHFPWLLPISIS